LVLLAIIVVIEDEVNQVKYCHQKLLKVVLESARIVSSRNYEEHKENAQNSGGDVLETINFADSNVLGLVEMRH
jgi:hypothetical protein